MGLRFKKMEELIEKIKQKVKASENKIIEKFEEEEEDLTGRLLGNLERDFKEIKSDKYEIETHILKRKGPKSEENITGADFIIILNVNSRKIHLHKYFLAQAKKCNTHMSLKFDKILRDQCRKMIEYTSDSFIFIYSSKGIYVKSALNELLKFKNIYLFLEDFLSCFIGDIYTLHPYPLRINKKIHRRNLLFWDYERLSKYVNILSINIKEK